MQAAPTDSGPDDATLVGAAVAGDRDAFAAIYDRYADRVFATAARLLGAREDAADCTADVFLIAAERLHQLRDPDRLRAWLFAIARHEAYRRTRHRNRETPTETMADIPELTDEPTADLAAMRALLDDAAGGLDERDRLLMALSLDGDLDGDELAAALGTSTATAHVATHRMRDRLATSVGALVVARTGRADCAELDRLLSGWDGRFDVLTRKRLNRHIEHCDICQRRRRKVPAAVLSSGSALAAPPQIRDRVLGEIRLVSHTGAPWSADGFPPRPSTRRRGLIGGVAAAILLLVTGVAVITWPEGGTDVRTAASTADPTTTVAARRDPTTVPSTSTTTVPATTVATTASSTAAPTTVAGVAPTTTSRPTVTTTTLAATPPAMSVSPTTIDLGTAATTATVVVTNTGGSTASLTLASGAAWLTPSMTSATLAPGAALTVTVTANRSALGEGTTRGVVSVALAGSNPVAVTVSATVAGAGPSITLTTVPAQFGVTTGCNVGAQVSDPAGVASVVVEYSTGSGTAQQALSNNSNGPTWSGAVSVGLPVRTVTWRVIATDALGNQARSADRTTPAGSFCS